MCIKNPVFAFGVLLVLGILVCVCSAHGSDTAATPLPAASASRSSAPQGEGTSVVVLIDFSKSFTPLTKPDELALEQVAAATASLAQDWPGPVTILWSRIQSASLVSSPICGPFQFENKLIGTDKGLQYKKFVDNLNDCTTQAVQKAAIPAQQSAYTDISGAIALATWQGQSAQPGSRYLVIFSDFIEDLPGGKSPVKFHLNGEHVLLLHRTGTQQPPQALADHIRRVATCSEKLLQSGAVSAVALPIVAVTDKRVIRALGSKGKEGTDVVVLQNLPDTASVDVLRTVSDGLTDAARDWVPPITIEWADVRAKPESVSPMAPVQFVPTLIHSSDPLQPDEKFRLQMNATSAGMRRNVPGAKRADLSGALNFYMSASTLDAVHVFLILSSFPESSDTQRTLPIDLSGVRVVLLAAPNREDARDEDAYLRRIDEWDGWLRARHASVCRIPLNGLTSSSLLRCMSGH
jgi:hypothetical protein